MPEIEQIILSRNDLQMAKYRWAAWGDVNAFFGLILDNIAVLVLLVSTIAVPAFAGPVHFSPEFVITRMVPGTALGVLLGDLVYTWMAFRLARRSRRDDVTAMPLGLDTPSTFAVGYLVLLPALRDGASQPGHNLDAGMYFAWHVGLVMLVLIGIAKTLLAPLGNAVRRWVPRAGLLGSLAAVALVLIAFLPLLFDIAASPLVGLLALTVILVSLVARQRLPGNVPGALAAVVIGLAAYGIGRGVESGWGWLLVPPSDSFEAAGGVPTAPAMAWGLTWWWEVVVYSLNRLPVMLPFALATVVGGIDCTESAAAVGDEYDTRTILLTEGLASVAAGLAGGVIQNTPYIGHPAYKAMGGRAAYTLATALVVGLLAWSGWFLHLFEIVPKAALLPILVFVGLEITAQSFHATPVKHYPALALAALPALAYLLTIPLNQLRGAFFLKEQTAALAVLEGMPVVQTVRCLANGFIVTSLLWGAALAAILDERLRRSAMYLLAAAAFSLVGIIHSPFADARIAWPWEVLNDLPPPARYLTPYHWAAAYGLMAGLLVALSGRRPAEWELLPPVETSAPVPSDEKDERMQAG